MGAIGECCVFGLLVGREGVCPRAVLAAPRLAHMMSGVLQWEVGAAGEGCLADRTAIPGLGVNRIRAPLRLTGSSRVWWVTGVDRVNRLVVN